MYRVTVFPAHAGMSLELALGEWDTGSFPRTRGDEPKGTTLSFINLKFSPHTRG